MNENRACLLQDEIFILGFYIFALIIE